MQELNAIVLYSGGFDSTALLEYVDGLNKYTRIYALYINYGNLNYKAEKMCITEYLSNKEFNGEVEFIEYKLPSLVKSSITGVGGKQGDSEYVPMRNLQFLSLASGLAEFKGARDIYFGVVDDETLPYPDSNPHFVKNFNHLVTGMTGGKVQVLIPFHDLNKEQIGDFLISNFGIESLERVLNFSVSCNFTTDYLGCGKCSSCEYTNYLYEYFKNKF